MTLRLRLSVYAAFGALLLPAASIQDASSGVSVRIDNGATVDSPSTPTSSSGTVTASVTGVAGPFGSTFSAFAEAGPGGVLRGSVLGDYTTLPFSNAAVTASSDASILGQVTFSCTGACGPTTNVSMNVDIDGYADLLGNSPYSSVSFHVITLILSGQVNNHIGVGNPLASYSGASGFFTAPPPGATNFSFANQTFTSPTVTVPVNTPVWVYLGFFHRATLYAGAGDSTGVDMDFTQTVQLSRLGQVFNVDAGIGVDSLDFGIVNNSFQTVPEPATAGLLAAAMLGLAWRQRRQV